MKTNLRIITLVATLVVGISIHSQGLQGVDDEPFPKDIQGNQYGFVNECCAQPFNSSEDKNIAIWGQSYFNVSEIQKIDTNGKLQWKKVLVPQGSIWIYQLLLANDGNIYVAGTLNGSVNLPNPAKKYEHLEMKSNSESDEGNPFLFKLNVDGKLLWSALLADDSDSYRIYDKPLLTYDKKLNQLTISTELRTGGGEDMPYLFRTYTINAANGKTIKAVDEEGRW